MRLEMRLLGKILFVCIVAGLPTQLLGQSNKDESVSDNPFSDMFAKVLRIEFDGENFVFSKRILVGKDGRDPVVVKQKITETYEVSVPYLVEIDGKSIRKYRKEPRTRELEVTKVLQGEYKSVSTAVDKSIKFYGLDGVELNRNAVIKKMGMKSAYILILREGQNVPSIWKSVMMPNVMVVYSNKLIDESLKNIR